MSQNVIMHVISGLHTGGAEMMLLRLLKQQKVVVKENTIVVSLTQGGAIAEGLREAGIKVVQLPRASFIKSFVALNRLVSEYNPNLIQSWLYRADLLAGLVGRLRRVNVIWNVRQTETARVNGQVHIWVIQRLNALLSYIIPSEIVYCAHAAKKSHQGIGYSKSKGVIISNGVDTERFLPDMKLKANKRHSLGIADDEFVIGMVARLDPLKNHERFFRVMNDVFKSKLQQKIRLLLVGRNIDTSNTALSYMLEQYDLEDESLLVGEQEDIPSFLNAMDIHLLTSDSEGWPNVLGEAMSSGCLCVATDVGDVSHILKMDSDSVVAKHDEVAMAKRITRFIGMSEQERVNWSKEARESIQQQYSLDETIEQYNRLYSDY